jgi:hypothetical protein
MASHDACDQRTAMRFISRCGDAYRSAFLVVQTDNGAEFQSQFHPHLADLDILDSAKSKPPTPVIRRG